MDNQSVDTTEADDLLTLAQPEPTWIEHSWRKAAGNSNLAAAGERLEEAVNGLRGVVNVLDLDERNKESAEHNAGVRYQGLALGTREELRMAARSLTTFVMNEMHVLRGAIERQCGER